jgi:hypothetical protein
MTSGAAPDAVKAARPVLNGEDEETGRKALRLVLTQLECDKFWHLGVGQQYPPVNSTMYSACLLLSKMCRKTYDNNQCQIIPRAGSFWTVRGRECFVAATGQTLSQKPGL